MIRHCVFIRFTSETTAAHKREIFREVAGLKARLPGFIAAHIGTNVSPETGMDKGYSDGFVLDFSDARARDAYLVDPEHQRVGAKIVACAEGGPEGIFVYDLEVDDAD